MAGPDTDDAEFSCATPYLRKVLDQAPRMVSMLDREPFSKSYGCFDRTYWCWKFTDFPGARFQEGVYPLAFLYDTPFPGNLFAGDKKVLGWIVAGIQYWRRAQYSNGAHDEAYPREQSLAAAAFSGFYVGCAFLRIRDRIERKTHDDIVGSLCKTGDWLIDHDETHGVLSNHLAAAAACLEIVHIVSGAEKYRQRSEYFRDRVLARQSDEGWYEEYGGCDPGYQTHAMFYLAWIWNRTDDSRLLESLRRAAESLEYFIHPDRTLGGEYASRNTEFYYPGGLEILAPHIPAARRIAIFMRPSVEERIAVGLAAMDAFNFFPLLNSYLFAAQYAAEFEDRGDPLPWQAGPARHVFRDAGLLVDVSKNRYTVVGMSKGGVVKSFDLAKRAMDVLECGYWAELKNGRIVSSQNFDIKTDWSLDDGAIVVSARFTQINQTLMSPGLFICFRLFTVATGRFGWFARWIKNLLVHVLVRRRKSCPIRLTRKIRLTDDQISVSDTVSEDAPAGVVDLTRGGKFSTFHMGSSRYFQNQEILAPDGETVRLNETHRGAERHILFEGSRVVTKGKCA